MEPDLQETETVVRHSIKDVNLGHEHVHVHVHGADEEVTRRGGWMYITLKTWLDELHCKDWRI